MEKMLVYSKLSNSEKVYIGESYISVYVCKISKDVYAVSKNISTYDITRVSQMFQSTVIELLI